MPLAQHRGARTAALSVLLLLLSVASAGCSDDGPTADVSPPVLGACRVLAPEDVAEASNSTEVVTCTEPHTAETYAVGDLPERFDDADYDDTKLGGWAYATCSKGFQDFLGADESLVMRTIVSWAWFRPSEDAWDDGARWYRCDVVGGGEQSEEYVALPTTARGLLEGPPKDEWLVCANGETVAGSVKVPCTEPHTWRAVTTISLGDPADPYPGDEESETTTRKFCSTSVGAWLNYPVDYDFGYTWFHEAEWEAGNRRSVCWAKTDQ